MLKTSVSHDESPHHLRSLWKSFRAYGIILHKNPSIVLIIIKSEA